MLSWTGHPLMDVGIATVCAMAQKDSPAELTLADLDQAAREMERHYFSGAMTSYLTCVFMNAEYVQPGTGPKKAESRKQYAERVLFAHRWHGDPEAGGLTCVFSGQPATHLIHRGQMPMLTGADVLNFFPAATAALPIHGPYLTALQALPLGGRRTGGRLLVAHSDAEGITLELARRYLADNRRLLALAAAGTLPPMDGPHESLVREHAAWDAGKKRPKYPDAKSASSLIVSDLIDIYASKHHAVQGQRPASMTAYWLSNSGQGPSLDVYHLPSNLLRFLWRATEPATRPRWMRLIASGWEELGTADEPAKTKKPKSKLKSAPVLGGPGRSRNRVLNDLFAVYESGFIDLASAHRFLSRHLLSNVQQTIRAPEECDWTLVELFLMEVLGMDRERIEAIRSFADRLAEHIQRRNDKQLFRNLVYIRRPGDFRNALTKAQRNEARTNNQLLFGLDDYLKAFEAEESVGRLDWVLVRDLISIRLVEQLHRSGFLTKDLLAEEPEGEPTEALS